MHCRQLACMHAHNLHVVRAGSIARFLHPVASLQLLAELQRVDPWVRGLPSTKHLPTGHSIGPLKEEIS